MKRWVFFILFLLAATFVQTEVKATVPFVPTASDTASLDESSMQDYNPIETPRTPLQIVKEGYQPQFPEDNSQHGTCLKGHSHALLLHYYLHSDKTCGHTAQQQSCYPRAVDHYIYAYRKIVI